jgi:hypothetical protein
VEEGCEDNPARACGENWVNTGAAGERVLEEVPATKEAQAMGSSACRFEEMPHGRGKAVETARQPNAQA